MPYSKSSTSGAPLTRSHKPEGSKWRRWLLLLPPLLLCLLLPWCRQGSSGIPAGFDNSESAKAAPIQELVAKELGPPPYFVTEGSPLPGRPEVGLPIPMSVFKSVTIALDGKPSGPGPFRFKAGQTVQVDGEVVGRDELPSNVSLGAGLALASKSDNAQGWVITHEKYSEGKCFNRKLKFGFTYTFPPSPGEYVLVIPSWAHTGGDHPALIAGQYDLILE